MKGNQRKGGDMGRSGRQKTDTEATKDMGAREGETKNFKRTLALPVTAAPSGEEPAG